MASQELKRVDLDDDDEVAQAARILRWIAEEKAKLKAKIDSFAEQEADAREVIEEALGGSDGEASEGFFENRPLVRWSKFTTHRFDQANFKKEHRDLFSTYYVEKAERRFSIVTEEKP